MTIINPILYYRIKLTTYVSTTKAHIKNISVLTQFDVARTIFFLSIKYLSQQLNFVIMLGSFTITLSLSEKKI